MLSSVESRANIATNGELFIEPYVAEDYAERQSSEA
jgi:hypothetical protein